MFEILTLLNDWIMTHQALVATIAIPLLTLVVTTISGNASEKRSEKSRKAARSLQKEMQMAEFRLKWIENLRNVLAEYNAVLTTWQTEKPNLHQLTFLMAKFQMMVNPEDPDVAQLVNAMTNALETLEDEDLKLTGQLHADICRKGQSFLKKEWERLKRDISSAETSTGT